MVKYLISYTETNWYSLEVESLTESLALAHAKNELAINGTDNMQHGGITESFFQVEWEKM